MVFHSAFAKCIIPIQIEKARNEGEQRTVKATVRSPQLKAEAKLKYGLKCYCCGFEFGPFYGDFAKNIAIVHHLKQFEGKRRMSLSPEFGPLAA